MPPLGIREAAAGLRARRLSAVELTDICLQRIECENGGPPSFDGAPDAINAWARLYPDHARPQAQAADTRLAAGPAPLLCGIPLAVKDLYGIAGLPLTASSAVLDGNVADADAAALHPLLGQGMVALGHTHTHEFAAGGTTDQVGNPRSLDRIAGGSSGGSAAALAAGMVPAALGSDTCGSLRIPSACCGTSALKPTHGLLPLDGIIPLAPSLDHPGPMARTIGDCAVLATGMGVAELPSTASVGTRPLEGVTIALTDRPAEAEIEPAVAAGLQTAKDACERLGGRVVERSAPWGFAWDDLSAVLLTEVWAYHSQYADRADRYRPAIAELVEIAGSFTDAEAYRDALARRLEGVIAWERWFSGNGIDLVLEPTLPIVPFERGPGYDRGHAGGPGDPLIALTALWDMTGMPVAALPVTWEVGVSLIAPRRHEAPLVQAAIDLQEHELGVPEPGIGFG
jgi:aspartyl-tRNA(Asn)/glutamyl-tRNA(Gln) amidotransferase subunit A